MRAALPYAAPFLSLAVSAAILSPGSGPWWWPGPVTSWSLVVPAFVILVLVCGLLKPAMSVPAAFAGLAAAALLSPPAFHLWGDGALRLRNLAAGFPAFRAAPLEMGDYLLHLLLTRAGISPPDTFRILGAAGGAAYLTGAAMLAGGDDGRTARACRFALLLTPMWVVFFTGYVESYSVLAGFVLLSVALMSRRGGALPAALAVLAAALTHLAGLLLLPGAVLKAFGEQTGRGRILPLTACACSLALPVAVLTAGGSGPLPSLRLPADIPDRLLLVLLACPAVPVALPLVRRIRSVPAIATASLSLAAFLLFPLERGAAVDWDLASVLMLPFAAIVIGAVSGGPRLLLPVVIASALAAGPRIGGVLDPVASERRFVQVLENSSDPSAWEEMAVLERDRGRLAEAGRLMERAWTLSGNGRHLAQLSEIHRLAGLPGLALEEALLAVGERPDLDTAWLQLALAARDAGRPREALHAAEGLDALHPGGPGLWNIALEAAVAAGDAETAELSVRRALEEYPGDPAVLTNAAWTAWTTGDPAGARSLLEEVLEIDPGNAAARYNLGYIAAQSGDTMSAIMELESALRLDPGMEAAGALLSELGGDAR